MSYFLYCNSIDFVWESARENKCETLKWCFPSETHSSSKLYMKSIFIYHNEKWQIISINLSLKIQGAHSSNDVMN